MVRQQRQTHCPLTTRLSRRYDTSYNYSWHTIGGAPSTQQATTTTLRHPLRFPALAHAALWTVMTTVAIELWSPRASRVRNTPLQKLTPLLLWTPAQISPVSARCMLRRAYGRAPASTRVNAGGLIPFKHSACYKNPAANCRVSRFGPSRKLRTDRIGCRRHLRSKVNMVLNVHRNRTAY